MPNISDSAITKAIYGTLLAAYVQPGTEDDPVPGDEVTGGPPRNCFLSYEWPGRVLADEQYQNPWTPYEPDGQLVVTEEISRLVDKIPSLAKGYSPSGNRVEQTYELLLGARVTGAVAAPAGVAVATAGLEKLQPELAQLTAPMTVSSPEGDTQIVAHSEAYLEERRLHLAYDNARANYIANRTIYTSHPALKRRWDMSIKPELGSRIGQALAALEAFRSGEKSRQPAAWHDDPQLADDPVARAFLEARAVFEKTRRSSIHDPKLQYHPSYLSPSNFAESGAAGGWPSVSDMQVKLERPQSGDPSVVSIAFRFARVEISRPWLMLTPLEMTGWELTGQQPGSASTGTTENNPGYFPLIPTSLVVARDLTISGAGKTFFEAKGLQILAWISRVVPYAPPAPA